MLYQKFLEKAVLLFGKNNFADSTSDPNINYQGNNNRSSFDSRLIENYNNENRSNNWNSENDFDDKYREGNGRETTPSTNYNANGYDGYNNNYNREDSRQYSMDTFNMFESAPRYGLQHNLLFSVKIELFLSLRMQRLDFSRVCW